MHEYEVTPDEANRVLEKCDEALESDGGAYVYDAAYVRGVKDALGWVLGHYEEPEIG